MPTGHDQAIRQYIRSSAEIPPGSRVLIYGAGGRGKTLLREMRKVGEDRLASGFLDSFEPGRASGLPVHPVSELSRVLDGMPRERTRIVVASSFHRAIARELHERGINDYLVYLDPDEGIPCAGLPENAVLNALNASRNPIARPAVDTRVSEGRVWRCSSLSAIYLRPTGLSVCCWMQDLAACDSPENAVARMSRLKQRIVKAIDAGECAFCAACPELRPLTEDTAGDRVSLLHMDISTTCNLDCAYCNAKNTHRRCSYDPAAVLAQLRRNGLLDTSYRFDWGGFGEPAINPLFTPLTSAMLDDGASGLVYTNALVRLPVIEQGLGQGRLSIVCSIDAGTRETYRAVRNVDAFDVVWKNIEAYAALNPDKVILKYIVTPDNAGAGDTDAFVDRCIRAGVRNVLIAKDFFAKRTPAAVREGVRRLAVKCAGSGLGHSFLATAISPAFIRSLKLKQSSAV